VLNKSVIALTAAVVFGSLSAAFAYEDPENRIGDRYPSLEPTVAAKVLNVSQNRMVVRQTASATQVAYEDPESRTGDRYPGLDQTTRSPSGVTAGRYLAVRYASNVNQNSARVDDTESKIADRYPLLEQRTASRQFAARLSSRSPLTTGSIR
jgi:hypothetical protein